MMPNNTHPVMTKRKRGEHYEHMAEAFLMRQGATVLARNFHAHRGEIDRVMLLDHVVLFVEVRFRQLTQFSHPLETINLSKQRKIEQTAKAFLQKHPQWHHYSCRFDVIAITRDNAQPTLKQNLRAWPWEIDWAAHLAQAKSIAGKSTKRFMTNPQCKAHHSEDKLFELDNTHLQWIKDAFQVSGW